MMQDLLDKIKRNRYLILLFIAVAAVIAYGVWNYIRTNTIPADLKAKSPLQRDNIEEIDKVYVCTGKSSTKFHHTFRCKGLDNCAGDLNLQTAWQADSLGYTPCSVCYTKLAINGWNGLIYIKYRNKGIVRNDLLE